MAAEKLAGQKLRCNQVIEDVGLNRFILIHRTSLTKNISQWAVPFPLEQVDGSKKSFLFGELTDEPVGIPDNRL